jgi:ATP-dependent 26S proteasome regulatory subunit
MRFSDRLLGTFTGTVVFTTNLIANYDPAFARRFNLLVELEMPKKSDIRRNIWEVHIPCELPVDEDVDFHELAEEFVDVSGGDIKNAVIGAVIRAAGRSNIAEAKRIR